MGIISLIFVFVFVFTRVFLFLLIGFDRGRGIFFLLPCTREVLLDQFILICLGYLDGVHQEADELGHPLLGLLVIKAGPLQDKDDWAIENTV